MHELSICQQIIKQVDEIALQNNAVTVESITLQLGPLSGVEAALLKQAFPFAAAQTLAENAELIIEECPVVILCQTCGAKSNAATNKLVCSQCGDYHTQLVSGDEMLLASVELIKAEANQLNHKSEESSVEFYYV
jgi:hydrogenase nickel incorporation protein HypA/HybF